MLHYYLGKPLNPLLSIYVDEYFGVTGTEPTPSKKVLPRPGTAITFDFNGRLYNGDTLLKMAVSGFHTEPYSISSVTDCTDCFVVRLSPYGLSRFINIPACELTNKIVDAKDVFGNEVEDVFKRIEKETRFEERINIFEDFLLQHLTISTQIDEAIFTVADMLKTTEDIPLADLRKSVPLSQRQLERRFKQLIGVDMHTYIAVCRFHLAKSIMLEDEKARLTDVAYDANYYDQPHFSNSFKKLTGVTPNKYDPCGEGMKD